MHLGMASGTAVAACVRWGDTRDTFHETVEDAGAQAWDGVCCAQAWAQGHAQGRTRAFSCPKPAVIHSTVASC